MVELVGLYKSLYITYQVIILNILKILEILIKNTEHVMLVKL